MSSSTARGSGQVEYVYGIVRSTLDVSKAPPGLDSRPVRAVREGEFAALTSALESAEYGGDAVDAKATDLEWLGPRATAHDAVVTWANEPGPVVPLPMWTLFSDEAGVSGMLAARANELETTMARVAACDEYSLRLFVKPAELGKSLSSLRPELAEIEKNIATATPGQRYLLQRKLEAARKEHLRTAARDIASKVFGILDRVAAASKREGLPRSTATASPQPVLNAVYLVKRAALDAFRTELTRLVNEYSPQGFHFEFTGPWPPYHFVGGDADER